MRYKRRAPRRYRKRLGGRRVAIRPTRPMRAMISRTNPTPTFVETFLKETINVVSGIQYLDAWKLRISDIPQIADYTNLYNQYRINWVKHILIPAYDMTSADANQAAANLGSGVLGYAGQARFAYAIQNSPNVQAPANEQQVLEDNGAKIVTLKSKFSMAHKPVPDIAEFSNAGGTTVYTKQKYKQFFTFTAQPAANPLHGAVQVALNLTGANLPVNFYHYVKVSFTLRDPK